ncbi:hypothetical protein CCP3SC5AM1_3150001 [Gammaproteobacteria bacterium]
MDHVIAGMLDNLATWNTTPEKVQWLVIHAQLPSMFQFSEDKKKIDFNEIDIFKIFPNLQGIIAGDIHMPQDGELLEKGRRAYLGYCGSLGITDMTDANLEKSVLYCDGKNLYRLPFEQKRKYVKIRFRGDNYQEFEPTDYNIYKGLELKPIFSVDYDSDSEPYLTKLASLYSIGYVRPRQTIRVKTGGEEVVVNVRSEMKTEEKIEAALKASCTEDLEVYGILSEALYATDPRLTFDTFKKKSLI